tara:strand:+ start:1969 stop:2178 length:210 start_codon:yes stop_codon:yes gene_type:complete
MDTKISKQAYRNISEFMERAEKKQERDVPSNGLLTPTKPRQMKEKKGVDEFEQVAEYIRIIRKAFQNGQ